MIRLTFSKQNSGCYLENRLEVASVDAGRPFRETVALLQMSQDGKWMDSTDI